VSYEDGKRKRVPGITYFTHRFRTFEVKYNPYLRSLRFMPTLQFKGKSSVWNHHLAIPYHTLEAIADLGYQPDLNPKTGTQIPLITTSEPAPVLDNLLIEGDNLLALKALLPQFAGRVKCIYIDPPYNTGADKEKWVYNDNVNSPLIREWLGKVVGKDDLTRHDKWLCMMTPRLKLLREFLAKDGVIFISCDDNEQANLRNIANEIFGDDNWVGSIIWKNVTDNNPTQVVIEHENIHCYALEKTQLDKAWKSTLSDIKDKLVEIGVQFVTQFEGETELQTVYKKWFKVNKAFLGPLDRYKFIDKGGIYTGSQSVHNPGKEGYRYDVLHPNGKPTRQPLLGYRFPFDPTMKQLLEDKRILFGETEDKIIELKVYAHEYEDKLSSVISLDGRVGANDLKDIFPEAIKVFDYPKPVDLIKQLLAYVTTDNDLILDSFAGSGTTGQAVMELNKEDGGNRRFILIQMPENSEKEPDKNICRDITRQRLHRAIDKFGYRAGFQYWQVGQALDAETLLSGQLPSFETFARYVYYLCTGENLSDTQTPNPETYLVGTTKTRAIYLVYQPDFLALTKLALNLSLAQQMQQAHPKRKIVVYAPACFLDDEHLEAWQIEFVGIPYNLFQRTA
jgi:adenine-specific DNA-methyltransferase